MKGEKQTLARDINIKAVITALQTGQASCSDLAQKLHLSKPALTKITASMLEQKLIRVAATPAEEESRLGRKRVYFEVDPDFGYVIGIDFSSVNIRIEVCDMVGREIAVREIEDREFVDREVLGEVVAEVKRLMTLNATRNKRLLALCVGASGKVNKRTGRIVQSPKFKAVHELNLIEYLKSQIDTNVIVKNDINLAMLGELKRSGAAEIRDCVLVYVDSGLGGAVYLNGSLIEGRDGYAGEIGLNTTYDARGKKAIYDQLCSINGIKDALRERIAEGAATALPEGFRFRDVAKAYREGDALTVEVVDGTAEKIAELIGNVVDFLNCELILLSGRVRDLGERYLDIIRSRVARKHSVEIRFTSLAERATIVGAVCVAIDAGFDAMIECR